MCEHREVNFQQGTICGLTGKVADFDDECPDFREEPGRREQVYQTDMALTGDAVTGDSKDHTLNVVVGIAGLVLGPIVFASTLLGFLPFSGGVLVMAVVFTVIGGLMLKRGLDQKKVREEYLRGKAEAEARAERDKKLEQ